MNHLNLKFNYMKEFIKKVRNRLAMFFINVAGKIDESAINSVIKIPPVNVIQYDSYHTDKLHAQIMISRREMEMNKNTSIDIEQEVFYRLTDAVTDEIMNKYKNNVKKIENENSYLYSLDVYVYKPEGDKL